MGTKKNKISLNSLVAELIASSKRHQHLLTEGGQDPFWADGCNANLVRNHIIHYKYKIKEFCEENNVDLPPEYFDIKTPDEVSQDFMAKPDEIRTAANKAEKILKPYYEQLVEKGKTISEKQKDKVCFHNVCGYYKRLLLYIERDSLIDMRRYKWVDHYIESFVDCMKKIDKLEPEEYQLSFF